MGKIRKSTIYILLLFILILVTMSINKFLAIALSLIVICILLVKYSYLYKIIRANKLYAAKNYEAALKLYRDNVNRKNIPGFIINNYLIMELKYGDSTIAEKFANNLSTDNIKAKQSDIHAIEISKALISWKNNKSTEAISSLKELLNETESTYLYETLTSLLIVNNKLDDALTIIDKGLAYTDSSSVLKSNYAEVQYLLGNSDKSEAIFKELTEDNVSFIEPYYYLGLILLDKSAKEEALSLFERALTLNDSLVTLVSKEKITNLIASLKEFQK